MAILQDMRCQGLNCNYDCNYLRTRLIKVFSVQAIVGMFVYMQNIRHPVPLVAFLRSNIYSRNRVATITTRSIALWLSLAII